MFSNIKLQNSRSWDSKIALLVKTLATNPDDLLCLTLEPQVVGEN